jgi:hypothetical protein
MGSVSRDAARALVERSCAEQGLPVKVSSASVVSAVSCLLGAGREHGGLTAAAPMSETPNRLDPVRVDAGPAPSCGGPDNDMAEGCGDDGALAAEIERGPLAS